MNYATTLRSVRNSVTNRISGLFIRQLTLIAMLLWVIPVVVWSATPVPKQVDRAHFFQNRGLILGAISEYQSYLKIKPDDIDARFELVALLEKLEHTSALDTNLIYLRSNVSKDPRLTSYKSRIPVLTKRKPVSLLETARAFEANGEIDRSVDAYRIYLQQHPADLKIRMELARMLGWNRRFDAATSELSTLLAKAPGYTDALLLKGDHELWQGHFIDAIESYRAVYSKSPNSVDATRRIAEAETARDYFETALLRYLPQDRTSATRSALARLYLDLNRIQAADSLNQISLATDQMDSSALHVAEEILATRDDSDRNRMRVNLSILQSNPTDTTVLLETIRFYNSIKDFRQTKTICSAYLALRPDDYIIRLERAKASREVGNFADALADYREVKAEHPELREASIGIAQTTIASGRDLESAELLLRADLVDNPRDRQTILLLGDLLLKMNRVDEARAQYRNVLDKTRGDPISTFDPIANSATIRLFDLHRQTQSEFVPAILSIDSSLSVVSTLNYGQSNPPRIQNPTLNVPVAIPQPSPTPTMDSKPAEPYDSLSFEVERLEHSLSDNPGDIQLRHKFASMLVSFGKDSLGLIQYYLLSRIVPDSEAIVCEYAELLKRMNRQKDAVEIYRLLATKYPSKLKYRVGYAEMLYKSGRETTAKFEFSDILANDSSSVPCLVGLGNIERKKGNYSTALYCYRQALHFDPNNREAMDAIGLMSKPRKTYFLGTFEQYRDNSDLWIRDIGGTIGSIILIDHELQFGGGSLGLEQHENSETGNYGLLRYHYQIDPMNEVSVEGRYIQWAKKKTGAGSITYSGTYATPDSIHLATWSVSVGGRDAIFDVASSDSLKVLTGQLQSRTGRIQGHYDYQHVGFVDVDASVISVSDTTVVYRAVLEPSIEAKPKLYLGLRGEINHATKRRMEYWTPDHWYAVGAWFMYKRDNARIAYSLRADVGTVSHSATGYGLGQCKLQYHLSNVVDLSGSYEVFRIQREQTRFEGERVTGSIAIRF